MSGGHHPQRPAPPDGDGLRRPHARAPGHLGLGRGAGCRDGHDATGAPAGVPRDLQEEGGPGEPLPGPAAAGHRRRRGRARGRLLRHGLAPGPRQAASASPAAPSLPSPCAGGGRRHLTWRSQTAMNYISNTSCEGTRQAVAGRIVVRRWGGGGGGCQRRVGDKGRRFGRDQVICETERKRTLQMGTTLIDPLWDLVFDVSFGMPAHGWNDVKMASIWHGCLGGCCCRLHARESWSIPEVAKQECPFLLRAALTSGTIQGQCSHHGQHSHGRWLKGRARGLSQRVCGDDVEFIKVASFCFEPSRRDESPNPPLPMIRTSPC